MSVGTMAAPAIAATGAAVGAAVLGAGAVGSAVSAPGSLLGGGGGGNNGGGFANISSAQSQDSFALQAIGPKAFGNTNANTNTNVSNATSSGKSQNSRSDSAITPPAGKPESIRLDGDSKPSLTSAPAPAPSPSPGSTPTPDAGATTEPNAFNDPNAPVSSTGDYPANVPSDDKSLGQPATKNLHQFGLGQLRDAAQHLKTSDGATGIASIRLTHTD